MKKLKNVQLSELKIGDEILNVKYLYHIPSTHWKFDSYEGYNFIISRIDYAVSDTSKRYCWLFNENIEESDFDCLIYGEKDLPKFTIQRKV